MGVKAAQILMERLRGVRDGLGTALEMPFNLVQRNST
jgi:LacI family transcriptional regulator